MRIVRVAMMIAVAAVLLQGCGDGKSGVLNPIHTHFAAAVQVEPANLALEEGETFQMAATATCECGEVVDADVTWRSVDPSVATVDENGLVTAVLEGTAEIVAEVEGKEGSVTGQASLQVDPTGQVIPVTGGTVSYLSGTVVLEVPDGALSEPTKITIRPAAAEVAGERPGLVGRTAFYFRPEGLQLQTQARLTIRYEDGQVPAGVNAARLRLFHRTQSGWAELTDSRLVAAERTVTGLIDGFSHYAVAESELTPVDRVVVAGAASEPLMIGATLQLTATLFDASGNALDRPVDWTSSDETVATVDETGLVAGLARGEATVTASAEGVSGSVTLNVRGEPTAGYGNNLSYPVIFADGISVGGTDVAEEDGLRPAPEEGIVVDALPFFWEGNAPDYESYYEQQGSNVWQAEWADGRSLAWSGDALVAWGDNLTHQTWNTQAPIRIENTLYAADVAPMQGFVMTLLYGEGPDEMQGTDGTTYETVPTVYSVLPRLTIQKLSGMDPGGEHGEPACTVFDGSIYEGAGADGPGSYSAEVNVSGKIVYGYNFTVADVTLCPGEQRFGWWRITFRIDEQGTFAGRAVSRSVNLTGLDLGEDGGTDATYAPQIDPAGHVSWLDIYVEQK